jgi:hypothetical protein
VHHQTHERISVYHVTIISYLYPFFKILSHLYHIIRTKRTLGSQNNKHVYLMQLAVKWEQKKKLSVATRHKQKNKRRKKQVFEEGKGIEACV